MGKKTRSSWTSTSASVRRWVSLSRGGKQRRALSEVPVAGTCSGAAAGCEAAAAFGTRFDHDGDAGDDRDDGNDHDDEDDDDDSTSTDDDDDEFREGPAYDSCQTSPAIGSAAPDTLRSTSPSPMSVAHATPLDLDRRSADGHHGADSARSLSHSPATSLSYSSVPPFSVPSRPSLSSADSDPHDASPFLNNHHHKHDSYPPRITAGPGSAPDDSGSVVEPSFDESVLRALCELDCGVPLLLDRIKQGLTSCREAASFFKRRAALEEEYGRNLQKMAKSTSEAYALSDGKAGSYVNAWQTSMKIHDIVAENRMKFSSRLKEMADELATLAIEVEKSRKSTKDLATRYERTLQDSELTTEKCKLRFDQTAEELERLLLQKEGESLKDNAVQGRPGNAGGKRGLGKAVAKGGLLLKGKNFSSIQRQEDDVRARMSAASDGYRKAVIDTQSVRQEYFNFQLPRILRALKECADELDLGTQYHLTRYAFLFESTLVQDGAAVAPVDVQDGPGIKATVEAIDNRGDFKTFMQNYAYAHGGVQRGPRRTGPEHEGFLPPPPQHVDRTAPSPRVNGSAPGPATSTGDRSRATFGIDLAEQLARDGADVPPLIVKLAGAIEKYGLGSVGIYRVSGTMSKINKLREKLDRDMEGVSLDAEEWAADINNVASVMKLWFRELPEPLLTGELHQGFLDAASIENDRLRHIRLHERVNELPDPNYSTLKYFLGHLNRIAQFSSSNQMSVSNLAIVFGPTLFSQNHPAQADPMLQNKAIETILEHYTDIFVDEADVQSPASGA